MIDFKIDWEILNKLENPTEKAFFEDIKKRMDGGEKINPAQFLNGVSKLAGHKDPDSMKKLEELNSSLSKITEAFNKIGK